MSDIEEIAIRTAPKAPTSGILRVEPHHLTRFDKCEIAINYGIFFDGTRNNEIADRSRFAHTNVVRLFDAYIEDRRIGLYKTYIPGVGTPFPELGEEGESSFGSAFGIGCEQRALYALTAVLNSIHSCAFGDEPYLTPAQVRALCRTQSLYTSVAYTEDIYQLQGLDLKWGLRMPDFIGDGERDNILGGMCRTLERKLEKGRPRVKECLIDVFGFSRGAAEARVFCNWLDRLLVQGKLAGVVLRFRFLGIIDTVASAGFWDGILAGFTGATAIHRGWAAPEFLRIPDTVENCVHMVAMHELRRNFPLDAISINEGRRGTLCQVAYPGAHSDVGGGYLPRALGISAGKDALESDGLKLSQIPLNHMLECAVAAGAPMQKAKATLKHGYDPFSIDPRLQKAYDVFMAAVPQKALPLHQWLQPFLNWRWQQRKTFNSLAQVQKANQDDRALLIKFNRIFTEQGEALERARKRNFWELISAVGRDVFSGGGDGRVLRPLEKEAVSIHEIACAATPTPPALHAMFDGFVHDSLAGFDMEYLEGGGHWRYRKAFHGSNRILIGANEQVNDTALTA